MSVFTAIDLSRMTQPAVVEQLDYETILAAMRADLITRAPELAPVLALESEPLVKLLEVAAYRELILRQRVNDAARATMLAYAQGADLDQIAARYNITRLVIHPGDATATPPVPPVYESDDDLRKRCLLAMEGLSNAGTSGAYVFHALSSDPRVLDAEATSPAPGQVVVHVLSRDGDGTATPDLLAAVAGVVGSDEVRPLCDAVSVQSAAIKPYAVTASLTIYSGPDPVVVRQAAEAACARYVAEHHRLGHDITLSGLYAALHQPGVHRVTLASPTADIVCAAHEAAHCTGIAITVSGIDE
ncbi:MAG: baseplate J/gp47 family protein [Thiohalomonadaceae bacterium]